MLRCNLCVGVITLNDLRRHFRDKGDKMDERLLHELLNEVDLDKNGEVNMVEWLQVGADHFLPCSFSHLQRVIISDYSYTAVLKVGKYRRAASLASSPTTPPHKGKYSTITEHFRGTALMHTVACSGRITIQRSGGGL